MNRRGHRLFLYGLVCLSTFSGLLVGCSNPSGTTVPAAAATGTTGNGGTSTSAAITGVATPSSVSVVTAN